MKNKFDNSLQELLDEAEVEVIEFDQSTELPATAASSGSSSGHSCSTCGSSSCSSC